MDRVHTKKVFINLLNFLPPPSNKSTKFKQFWNSGYCPLVIGLKGVCLIKIYMHNSSVYHQLVGEFCRL